jgi:hypothetical protein
MSTSTSDHCPLLLNLALQFNSGKRFRFESFWRKADGFLETVEEAWASTPPIVNPFKRLAGKLSATARALCSWSDRFIGNNKLQILVANELILRLDVAMESRALSEEEDGFRRLLKRKLLGLASLRGPLQGTAPEYIGLVRVTLAHASSTYMPTTVGGRISLLTSKWMGSSSRTKMRRPRLWTPSTSSSWDPAQSVGLDWTLTF